MYIALQEFASKLIQLFKFICSWSLKSYTSHVIQYTTFRLVITLTNDQWISQNMFNDLLVVEERRSSV